MSRVRIEHMTRRAKDNNLATATYGSTFKYKVYIVIKEGKVSSRKKISSRATCHYQKKRIVGKSSTCLGW